LKQLTSKTNKKKHNYIAMDYYQKPPLFAIFLSFVPQIFTIYSEISKTKLISRSNT